MTGVKNGKGQQGNLFLKKLETAELMQKKRNNINFKDIKVLEK